MLSSVELFAGAGGLGMGLSLAGFEHRAVVEWDRWACDTIRENQQRGHPLVANWPLFEGDVRSFDYSALGKSIDLVAGGPPCQPFSLAGKHGAYKDERDMFPAAVEVVRQLRPRAFIFENVKGLLRESFSTYFAYVLLRLEFPEQTREAGETWQSHRRRLERQKTAGHRQGLSYNIVFQLLNAADYGVPQRRERVFIVGFRNDLGVRWSFPQPTHSEDALAVEKWVTGDYWERHRIKKAVRPEPPSSLSRHLVSLQQRNMRPTDERRAWRTVRDALVGLPDPEGEPTSSARIRDHKFQPGVRFYKGHTGSPLDLPAKTLKAGDHGVPGGENALVRPDGSGRYFTPREAARLQTFPDAYVFHGAWTEVMRQLGNAVPVSLAHVVGASVARNLIELDMAALLGSGTVTR
ncbi:MAG: DNA cytosine methyltransferase [Roseomonas sp.]|nr:DNA cytosine methyltransferase [Roseomonas sp.]